MSHTILIYGPQGCGKTRSAQALMQHFGLRRVVDDFDDASDKVPPGSLAISNEHPTKHALRRLPTGTKVMRFDEALREAGLPYPAGLARRDN